MSAPAPERRSQEPPQHPEQRTSGPAVVLSAGSDVVRGFASQRDALDSAVLFARVNSTRLEVHPAGCGRRQWWGVFPPDAIWRKQVRAAGHVHAHEVGVVWHGYVS